MALQVADRVQELSTTSGTGTLTLNGAVPGFQTFSAGIGNSNTTYYTIYDPTTYDWEVGIGTVGAGTLSRDTVLSNSLGTTAKINLAGNSVNVFVTYPSEKSVNLDSSGNVSPLGTISSGTWQGSTVGVAYGGTGVTASSGANSVVLRDSNQNIVANKISQSVNNITASGGTTSLTAASAFWQTLQGTGAHTIKLPDATTLPIGFWYVFDNDSTGNLTIQDFASSTLDVVPPGGYSLFYLDDIASVAGSWNRAGLIPSEVNWGTNSLDLGGSTVITNGTWQGTAVAPAYGGTGLTTFSAANNALYSTGATTLTAGTLPIAAGGTGNTSGQAASVANALSAGTGLSFASGTTYDGSAARTLNLANTAVTPASYTYASITVDAQGRLTAASSGTSPVTSVAGTSPISSSGGTTPTISISQASSTTNGFLSSTDWNTFNNKGSGTVTSITAGTGLSGGTITTSGTIAIANTAVTAGSYTYASITVDAQGRLTAASSGTAPVTSVGATSPVASSGGSTPTISLASGYGDTQNPYASKTANFFLAAPNGSAGAPTFRAIVAADIPTLNQNTTGTASNVSGIVAIANGGTGASTAPNARTNLGATTVGSNFFTLTNPSAITFPRINADNTVSTLDAATFRSAIGAGTGSGTVTSITVSAGTGMSGGGTVTTSGTVTLTNAGVTSVSAGTGISVSASTGGVTITNSSPNQLTTTAGSPPYYGARAWVNFNGTGTVAIRASMNVSSITDNGTGNYTINFTTAMPDVNYNAVGADARASNDYGYGIRLMTFATGSLGVNTITNNAASLVDYETVCITVFR